ncbi:MAG: hypothetical protein KC493_17735 [Bacteriovoracaceae bacterium]|nr:hypothetical protein [Bacteriovoracaceae bacterium]
MKNVLSLLVFLALSTTAFANPPSAVNCNEIQVVPSDSLASICVDENDRLIGDLYRYQDNDGSMKMFGDFNTVNMVYCPTNVRDYNAICRSLGGTLRSNVESFYRANLQIDCEEKVDRLNPNFSFEKRRKHLQLCRRTRCIQNSNNRRERQECRQNYPL